ncbi:MAG: efflux RND transporter periplasmic adaptor subunit [Acidobacteriota bacterium]|nr:efflux RND transporter periplasmic adaptor subunit [Acidobacteriota bacterium]
MRRGRLLAPIIGIALLAIALPLALTSRATSVEAPPIATKRVEVAPASTADVARDLRFSGIVRAERHAELSFPLGGRLVRRPVDLGDRVRAGQVLAELDLRQTANALESARAALAEVEARRMQTQQERQRVERLAASGAATAEELEQVTAAAEALEAAKAAAQARLEDARRMGDDSVLIASFAGTITEVRMEVGEYAGAGKTVMVVSGDGPLEVEVGVPEGLVTQLEPGSDAEARLPFAEDRTVPGTVRSLGRAAAGAGNLFPVVVALGEPQGVAPGMTAEVLLTSRTNDSVTVPLAAILNPGGSRPRVFRLIDDGAEEIVQQVAVRVEQLTGERVAVRGELEPGDLVVVSGHGGLLDGDTVEVVR